MVRNCAPDRRDRGRTRQFDAMQKIPAGFRGPQYISVGTQCNAVRHCEVRQHRSDGFPIRRDVIDTALWVRGGSAEIGEVKAAVSGEYQIVRHVSSFPRNDRLPIRSIRFHCNDVTRSLSDAGPSHLPAA